MNRAMILVIATVAFATPAHAMMVDTQAQKLCKGDDRCAFEMSACLDEAYGESGRRDGVFTPQMIADCRKELDKSDKRSN